jgi:hypothetical protein
MDIEIIQRQVTDLMAWKARAEPMLAQWEAHVAKERIGAEPLPLTEAQHAAHAKAVLTHAVNISRLLSVPPAKKKT